MDNIINILFENTSIDDKPLIKSVITKKIDIDPLTIQLINEIISIGENDKKNKCRKNKK
jgi:hypothetical protein